VDYELLENFCYKARKEKQIFCFFSSPGGNYVRVLSASVDNFVLRAEVEMTEFSGDSSLC